MLTGPRGGRARCVDGGVSVVCVRCHGVSPFWARIRWAGPRVRVYAYTDPVPGAPQAVCSQGASAAHLLLVLPGAPAGSSPHPHPVRAVGSASGGWVATARALQTAVGRADIFTVLPVSERLPRRLSSVSQGCPRAGLSPLQYFMEEEGVEEVGRVVLKESPLERSGFGVMEGSHPLSCRGGDFLEEVKPASSPLFLVSSQLGSQDQVPNKKVQSQDNENNIALTSCSAACMGPH